MSDTETPNDPDTPEAAEVADLKRITFTLALVDIARLEQLVRWRHPDDRRMLSLTVRELIREAYERERHSHP